MKKCLFCGRSAPEVQMTGEHVLRRKLIEQVLWGAPKERTETVFRAYADGTRVEMSRQIPESILDQELKDICGPCNSGWMNALENRAEEPLKALFQGRRTHVSETEAADLGTWATKTAMVRGRVDGDPYTVPEVHRTHLMNNGIPPEHVTVWAVTCQFHPSARTRHFRVENELPGTPILETDEDGETWATGVEARRSMGHVTTIVINHLALFIAEADSHDLHTELVTQLDPTGAATRLWPDPCGFDWPLAQVLTLDHVDAISGLLQPLPGNITR
ncbi:hypothetical protein [Streptomyces kronopolitis]|uniref:hypothetical protein n=1 Tax=Streptomyces kronopolitis TaxID=1612435 RepID=UPI0020C07BD4|nr:hypothetical protein [Streptomyces kronopolitis]MCL6302853.1 hypothetical protein [Streptomyces kronopolitis]